MASTRLQVKISGNLKSYLGGHQTKLAALITEAVNAASAGLQGELRSQVRSAGLGAGLEKAWRRQIYPSRKASMNEASLVYSKATALHQAYIAGATVLPNGHAYLVIATAEAVAMGFGYTAQMSRTGRGIPAGALRKYSLLQKAEIQLGAENLHLARSGPNQLVVIYRQPDPRGRGRRPRGGKAFKGPSGGFQLMRGVDVVLFVLVRQTRVKAVLDIAGPAAHWFEEMYRRIETAVAQSG